MSHASLEVALTALNVAMGKVSQWCADHCLSISAAKSKLIIFSRRRVRPNAQVRIAMGKVSQWCADHCLSISAAKSKLIIFSRRRVRPNAQVRIGLVNSCEQGLNILRALTGIRWGADPKCLQMVYRALIRSKLEFGGFLFFPLSKKWSSKLERVPGHTGVRGNEKADWLAKRGRALRCSNIRLDATNFYHQFRKQMFKEWQKWWEKTSRYKGSRYHEMSSS
ncbi:hypothetical protein QE152_g15346 [Popillia japonica]|uniref:RNase H type-1 domain-containing protein n=1 Tax=Popillia japonica TaxID=7064 RepID=A0AAW1L897_POPJA